MKRKFKIEGMSCNHCRSVIENALNRIPGVQAEVSLSPPEVLIDFEGTEERIKEFQAVLSEEGNYKISLL